MIRIWGGTPQSSIFNIPSMKWNKCIIGSVVLELNPENLVDLSIPRQQSQLYCLPPPLNIFWGESGM